MCHPADIGKVGCCGALNPSNNNEASDEFTYVCGCDLTCRQIGEGIDEAPSTNRDSCRNHFNCFE